jgi:cytochrome o ubiquinol oxidase subunit 2
MRADIIAALTQGMIAILQLRHRADFMRRRCGWLRLSPLALLALLSGCSGHQLRLLHPDGPIAVTSLRLSVIDVLIMLCIILPTGIFVAISLWRFRAARKARYDPGFTHSVRLEVLMWGVPFAAVATLAYFSWRGVFLVNPYAPTALGQRKSLLAMPDRPGTGNPLVIDVVATDWQWLFIYPDQHIATLNTLSLPAGRNIEFRLTATDVVNDFYIPQLIGMIDVMPGMRTKDMMRADRPGVWQGFSADISGAGFSWMQFPTRVMTQAGFAAWVAKTQAAPRHLDYARFRSIARPTIDLRGVTRNFSAVQPHLFSRIVHAAMNGATDTTPMFLSESMRRDLARRAPYLSGYPHS